MEYLTILKEHKININIETIIIGFNQGILSEQDIENIATKYLEENLKSPVNEIIELAWGNLEKYKIIILLEEIKKRTEISFDKNLEMKKWRFSKLIKINEMYKGEELLEKIAELYAEFNYPEDMENLIYYMPPKKSVKNKSNKKVNSNKNLFVRFSEFLEMEKEILLKVG